MFVSASSHTRAQLHPTNQRFFLWQMVDFITGWINIIQTQTDRSSWVIHPSVSVLKINNYTDTWSLHDIQVLVSEKGLNHNMMIRSWLVRKTGQTTLFTSKINIVYGGRESRSLFSINTLFSVCSNAQPPFRKKHCLHAAWHASASENKMQWTTR